MTLLAVRSPDLKLTDGFARYWHGGDPFRTMLFDSLSMMFPAGEQFFVDCVRASLPACVDRPELLRAAEGFVAQEASHRFMHQRVNAVLDAQGYTNLVDRWIRRRVYLSSGWDRRSLMALVIAYEHFTAVLGDIGLRHPAVLAGVEDDLVRLWLWHAAEESEHKAVAYDIYTALSGGYVRRAAAYLFVSLRFALDMLLQTGHSLRRDGQLWKARTWSSAARYLFGKPGLIWLLLPSWLRYLRPGFHPRQHDNEALVRSWLKANEAHLRVISRR